MCGHSYIFWAAHRTKKTSFGSQLGLSEWACLDWESRRGMLRASLLHLLFQACKGPTPHVLLIHLGGNDLGLLKGKALVLQAREDLCVIQRRLPGMTIVWSAMVPRRAWRNARHLGAVEKVRKKVNREFQVCLEKGLAHYLPHPVLSPLDGSLY